MNTALTTRNSADLVFGTYGDLSAFAKRIKLMCKGGDKLTENEALALAQVATVSHLNPFIGEVWYIPGSGPMVGIAGARRADQEKTAERGGYSAVEIIPCPPEEAGANEAELKDVVAAFRAEITDSVATMEYQKMFVATLAALRESGIADPIPAAREICGPRPKWVGYGYSRKNEQSRMNKTQLARKRAEADALKKKIVLPFGTEVAETDVSPDYIEAQAEPVKQSETQNLKELGFEPPVESEPVSAPAVQMYRYNDSVIMQAVAKVLNYEVKDAAQVLYQAFKNKQIGQMLTIEEAKEFATAMTQPK